MKTPENLNKWTMPDSYYGEEWPEYYVFLGRHRDSDELSESNFDCALKALGGESETVLVIRESHWAVGWVEWIAIHESDVTALSKADKMMAALEDYPVLDDEDFSRREEESAQTIWRDCYDVKERIAYVRKNESQFEFHDFADMLGCIRGKYFAGYASELIH